MMSTRRAAAAKQSPAGATRRGRPAAVSFSPEEVGELLSCPPARVVKALVLERAPGRGRPAPLFFPGAWLDGDCWRIPERDVKRLLGPELWRLLPVSEFAELVGFSTDYVYDLVERGALPARKIWGRW